MSARLDRVIDPLDDLRRALWRAVARAPALRRVMVRRELRVPVLISLYATLAFGLALLAPAWSLVLAPLVLGVPHVAADIRYLVVRRELPRSWCVAIGLFVVALLGVRILHESHRVQIPAMLVEHALGSTWLVLGALFGAAAGGLRARAVGVIAAAAGVSAFAIGTPTVFRYVLIHAHNVVAIAIWLVLFRRSLRLSWLPLLFVLAGALCLASGMWLPVTLQHGFLSSFGLHLFAAAEWIAPGVPVERAVALTLSFAFLQSVHYAIWLVAIPQEDARAQGSPTFRMKVRSLKRDFGPLGSWLVVTSALLVAVAGAYSPLTTRNVYLSLATFHSWLELAALAYFIARGSEPGFRRDA